MCEIKTARWSTDPAVPLMMSGPGLGGARERGEGGEGGIGQPHLHGNQSNFDFAPAPSCTPQTDPAVETRCRVGNRVMGRTMLG